MITFLKSTDREYYRKWVNFNLEYLAEIESYLTTNFDPDVNILNVLARDELDQYKIPLDKLPAKLHQALLAHVESRAFYGRQELTVMEDVLTYVSLSVRPDPAYITSRISPLAELHAKNTNISTESPLTLSRLIYNRARIMEFLETGEFNPVNGFLETGLTDNIQVIPVAEGICRVTGVHHALASICRNIAGYRGPHTDMIREVSRDMMSYRKSLINPDKVGYGEDAGLSEFELQQRTASPAVRENLIATLEKWSGLPGVKPADFILCLSEGISLSGINLMV